MWNRIDYKLHGGRFRRCGSGSQRHRGFPIGHFRGIERMVFRRIPFAVTIFGLDHSSAEEGHKPFALRGGIGHLYAFALFADSGPVFFAARLEAETKNFVRFSLETLFWIIAIDAFFARLFVFRRHVLPTFILPWRVKSALFDPAILPLRVMCSYPFLGRKPFQNKEKRKKRTVVNSGERTVHVFVISRQRVRFSQLAP